MHLFRRQGADLASDGWRHLRRRPRQPVMNQAQHPVATGHAQEAGPVERPRCRGKNCLSAAIGRGPHGAGRGEWEFGGGRGRHQRSPAPPGTRQKLQGCAVLALQPTNGVQATDAPALRSDDWLSTGVIETAKERTTADGPPDYRISTDTARALVGLFSQTLSRRISMVLARSTPWRAYHGCCPEHDPPALWPRAPSGSTCIGAGVDHDSLAGGCPDTFVADPAFFRTEGDADPPSSRRNLGRHAAQYIAGPVLCLLFVATGTQ